MIQLGSRFQINLQENPEAKFYSVVYTSNPNKNNGKNMSQTMRVFLNFYFALISFYVVNWNYYRIDFLQENICNYSICVWDKELSIDYSVRMSTEEEHTFFHVHILLFLILSPNCRWTTCTNVMHKFWWSKLLNK